MLNQVEGLHPLSLTLLDAGSERFVVRSVCGSAPCMEVAHLRLMTQQLAVSRLPWLPRGR